MTLSSIQTTQPEFRARFDAARDGVCVLGPDWKIRYANASLLEIFRLLGGGEGVATLWDALPGWEHTPEAALLRVAMQAREPHRFQLDAERSGGRVWEVEAEPLLSGELRMRLHNATHRVQREAAARGEVERGRRMVVAMAHLPVGVVVLEAAGWTVMEANDAALDLLALPAAVGRRLEELIPFRPAGALRRRLVRVARVGEPWGARALPMRDPDGTTRWVRVGVRRLEEQPAVLLATLVEVTREVAARRRARARGVKRARSEFLATLSHELRTPIHALEGYASLLEDGVFGPVSEQQGHALGRMRASQRHLLALIEQVLDAARLGAGARRPELVEVDADELAASVLESLRAVADRKSLALELDAPEPMPVRSDPGLLRQILTNVVGNALKFTERGGVRVAVRRHGSVIHLTVEDTGPGIAAEHLERIWEPYYQVEPAMTRREGGTGLGLALSRDYARLLGGEISVRSELGAGSSFLITLPLAP